MKTLLVVVAAMGIVAFGPPPPQNYPPDNTPPAAVTDLTVAVGFTTAVPLWTNTGDDGTVGTAESYEVRYSTSPITASNWKHADTFCSGTPLSSGSPQCCTGVTLSSGTTYYFAIKLKDDANNFSSLSNVVQITTHTSGSEVGC